MPTPWRFFGTVARGAKGRRESLLPGGALYGEAVRATIGDGHKQARTNMPFADA
jgi:hypothetical protein